MKRFFLYLTIVALFLGFQACSDDATNETPVDTFQQEAPVPDTLRRDTFINNGERVTGYDTSGMRN